jgi:hypothetical protein
VATSTAAIDVDMLGVAGLPGARPSFLLSLRLAVAPAGEGPVLWGLLAEPLANF